MLTLAVAFQRLEPICGRHFQGVQRHSRVQHSELAPRNWEYIGGKPFGTSSVKNSFGHAVLEAADHGYVPRSLMYRSTIRLCQAGARQGAPHLLSSYTASAPCRAARR